MPAKPIWRQREDALIWGAPLIIVPALAIVPVTVSLFLDPAFAHARLVGVLLIPFMALFEVIGFERIAAALRKDFDVLTFFAAGVLVTHFVVVCCSGILLALVIANS